MMIPQEGCLPEGLATLEEAEVHFYRSAEAGR